MAALAPSSASAPGHLGHPGRSGRAARLALLVAAVATLGLLATACGGYRPPPTPEPALEGRVIERGIASWYGPGFHGNRTASGEVYDMDRLTAAHRTLPFGTLLEVRNLDNGLAVRVRITDRGPFIRGRVIDLSRAAAQRIGMIGPGTARVELVLLPSAAPAGADRGGGEGLTGDRVVIQLGAFREPGRAQRLARRLEAEGWRPRLERSGGWHRVRLEGWETRTEAEEALRELRAAGYEAVLLAVP